MLYNDSMTKILFINKLKRIQALKKIASQAHDVHGINLLLPLFLCLPQLLSPANEQKDLIMVSDNLLRINGALSVLTDCITSYDILT